MKLLRNSEIQIEKWNDFLSASKYSSAFQTWEFYHFFNSLERNSAEAFAVEVNGVLKCLCVITIQTERGIKAHFSKRAIIYGGPVFIDLSEIVIEFLLYNIFCELEEKVIYVEVRNHVKHAELDSIFNKAGWKWIPYMNIRLLLKGNSLDSILGSMKYNRKREIKLSLKEGAIYKEAKNDTEVNCLYSLLKELYQKRVKLPLPDLSFFLALFRSPIGKVFITMHKNEVIGGSFCFYLKNESIYLMYYCGLRGYHPKIFPTHLSVLAAIDFGLKEQLKSLDFMGAGIKGRHYGVRNYKQEFGGELNETGRYRKINNKILFIIGEMGLKILRYIK